MEPRPDVVLKDASYRKLHERVRVAEVMAKCAKEDAESARSWAREAFAIERRLADRCTYLYGLAASLGATAEQLSGDLRSVTP